MKSTTHFFTLKVHTPVHIGCGEVYEPTGFVVNGMEKALIAFEPETFLANLSSDELSRFSAICRKGTPASLLEVYKFMNAKSEFATGRRAAVSEGFVEHYQSNVRKSNADNELNKFEISRTAFRSLDNTPYVPGSAIKGAMRTGVLNMRHSARPSAERRAEDLEKGLLGGSFDQDPFRLIKVSDFVAVEGVRQKIVYAVNRKKLPSEKATRGIPQILEVIEPGAIFFGAVTILDAHGRSGVSKPVTLQELHQALSSFYSGEMKREESDLRKSNTLYQAPDAVDRGAIPIRLGRHCGAESLTIEGKRDIKIMMGKGKQPKSLDHATTFWLAAESRTPSAKDMLQPFGWAGLTLLAGEEAESVRRKLNNTHKEWLDEHQESFTAYQEQLAVLRKEQEEAARKAEQLAEQKRKQEEEERLFPWRSLYPILAAIKEWGGLNTQVLANAKFIEHQSRMELAERVGAVAKEIAIVHAKKWNEEREILVQEWLRVSGLQWNSGVIRDSGPSVLLTANQKELLEKISSYSDWGHYQKNPIATNELDKVTGLALKERLSAWGCNERNAKKPKQEAYKALLSYLRSL